MTHIAFNFVNVKLCDKCDVIVLFYIFCPHNFFNILLILIHVYINSNNNNNKFVQLSLGFKHVKIYVKLNEVVALFVNLFNDFIAIIIIISWFNIRFQARQNICQIKWSHCFMPWFLNCFYCEVQLHYHHDEIVLYNFCKMLVKTYRSTYIFNMSN